MVVAGGRVVSQIWNKLIGEILVSEVFKLVLFCQEIAKTRNMQCFFSTQL